MRRLSAFPYAGSKRREEALIEVVGNLRRGYRVLEPFVGTGRFSLTFGRPNSCFGADTNVDVVELLRRARSDDSIEFWKEAEVLLSLGRHDPEFYADRRDEFNEKIREGESSPRRSALFWYVMNTCFSGVCSYNSDGLFNTPYDVRKPSGYSYKFHERSSVLRDTARRFRSVLHGDALTVTRETDKNDVDLIYCDPPYVQSYAKYQKTWTEEDLTEMDRLLDEVNRETGVPCLISNYDDGRSYSGRVERFGTSRMTGVNGVDGKTKKDRDVLVIYDRYGRLAESSDTFF